MVSVFTDTQHSSAWKATCKRPNISDSLSDSTPEFSVVSSILAQSVAPKYDNTKRKRNGLKSCDGAGQETGASPSRLFFIIIT